MDDGRLQADAGYRAAPVFEAEMRVDVCFDGLQFEFLHERFQLKRIHLLFPALLYIVVDEVDAVPHEEVYERSESVNDDDLGFTGALFWFTPQAKKFCQQWFQAADHKSKDQGDKDEAYQLLLQRLKQDVTPDDRVPHQVGNGKSQAYKNQQPPDKIKN